MIPWIIGAAVAALVIDSKVTPLGLGKYNPLGSKLPSNIPPPATPPGTPAVPTVPGVPLIPGTVDGHGTGVIDDPVKAAAAKAAADLNAAINGLPKQGSGEISQKAAQEAAEGIRMQIVNALNTPEADRTPEQAALLLSFAGLPNPT